MMTRLLLAISLLSGVVNSRAQSPPPNDDLINAQIIVGQPVSTETSGGITYSRAGIVAEFIAPNGTATVEANEPNHAGANPISTTWYQLNTSTRGELKITTQVANQVIAVYYKTNNQLTAVASTQTGQIRTPLNADEAYYIAIASPGNTKTDTGVQLAYMELPSNDNWVNATIIPNTLFVTNIPTGNSNLPVPVSTSQARITSFNDQATQDPDDATNPRSVWFTWTAPANGMFYLTQTGNVIMRMQVSSNAPPNFNTFAQGAYSTSATLNFYAVAGKTYYFRTWSDNASYMGAFSLDIKFDEASESDNFAQAELINPQTTSREYDLGDGITVPLTKHTSSLSQHTYGATTEVGEIDTHPSVWVKLPNFSGNLTLSLWNITGNQTMRLFQGESLASATQVAIQTNQATGTIASTNTYPLMDGATYRMRLSRYSDLGTADYGRPFALEMSLRPKPSNDDFANRANINLTTRTISVTWENQNIPVYDEYYTYWGGTTYGASSETGEPSNNGRTIWFTANFPQTTPVTLSTHGSKDENEAQADTVLAVYTGSVVNTLTTVGSNNDADGQLTSRYTLTPALGTNYQIRVDRNGSQNPGVIKLSVSQPLRPVNDMFTNATVITGAYAQGAGTNTSITIYGANYYGTSETGEPNATPSIWYRWVAPATGLVNLYMSQPDGASFQNVYVYTGTAVNSLTTVGSPTTALDGRINVLFQATAGTTYHVQVRSPGGGTSPFKLVLNQIDASATVASGNDNRNNAYQLATVLTNVTLSTSSSGNAQNATLETGELDAITALGNKANDTYTVPGTNSLWWKYTTSNKTNQLLIVYNNALVAYFPMRTSLGNPLQELITGDNLIPSGSVTVPWTGINASDSGIFFSQTNATALKINRKHTTQFRLEFYYTQSAISGGAVVPIIGSSSSTRRYLEVNGANYELRMNNAGTYGNTGFYLTPGQEYYIVVEGNVSTYNVWVNGNKVLNNWAGIIANTYPITYIGSASDSNPRCNGTIRDLRIYSALPVAHEAFTVKQGTTTMGNDDDLVALFAQPSTQYDISVIPLSTNSTVNLTVVEKPIVPLNDEPILATDIPLQQIVTTYAMPNGTIVLTNIHGELTGNSAGATAYTGERDRYPVGYGRTLWWKFTTSMPGTTYVTLNCNSNKQITVFPENDLYNSVVYTTGNGSKTVSFTAAQGATYYVQGNFQYYENFTLAIDTPPIPPNDNYTNAQTITLTATNHTYELPNGTVTIQDYFAKLAGYNKWATWESERLLSTDGGTAQSSNTVWWYITIPANGYYTFDASQSTFATQLGIKDTSKLVTSAYNATSGGTNKLTTYLAVGSYRLVVDGVTGANDSGNGGINLDVYGISSPGNDAFASTEIINLTPRTNIIYQLPNGNVPIPIYSARITGYNDAATLESERLLNLDGGAAQTSRTVFWRVVIPETGRYTFDVSQSTFAAQMGIKPEASSITASFSATSAGQPTMTVVLSPGNYRLVVDGVTSAKDAGMGGINLNIDGVVSPANDNLANSTPLSEWTTNEVLIPLPNGNAINRTYQIKLATYNVGATSESEYYLSTQTSIPVSYRSIWWVCTPIASGYLTVDTTKSTFATQIGIKLGTSSLTTTPLASSGNGTLKYWVTGGTAYRIEVDGTTQDAGEGGINLDITLQEPDPANDFPGVTPSFDITQFTETIDEFTITNQIYTYRRASHNIGANLQTSEYSITNLIGGTVMGQTLWWSFPAPVGGVASFSLQGSPIDTVLRAGALTLITSSGGTANDDYYGKNAALNLLLTAGTTYRVQVDSRPFPAGNEGGINLNIDLPAAPANDLFANRQVITPTTTNTIQGITYATARLAGSTTTAWNESENISTYIAGAANRNVWYSYTVPQAGTLYVTLKAKTPLIGAIYGSFNGTPYSIQAGTNITLARTATAGATLYILVDGQVPGPFTLDFRFCTGAPSNDNFANAIPLTNEVTTEGTLELSTRQTGERTEYSNGSVWYSFTPTCAGDLTVDTFGSEADTVIQAGTGTAVNAITPVAFNDNTENGLANQNLASQIRFAATAGTTYYIAVSYASGNPGKIKITPHMRCANAVSATPESGRFFAPFTAYLFNSAKAPIYYSRNGAEYQPYTDRQITYTNLVNMTISADGLPMRGTGTGWDAGFNSAETLAGDGRVECIAQGTTNALMFGLDETETGPSYTDIQYAFYFRNDKIYDVYENGVKVYSSQTNSAYYYPGDIGCVERKGGVVSYKLNGDVFYTSAVRSTATLHVDASLNSPANAKFYPTYLIGSGNTAGITITQGDDNGIATLAAYVTGGSTNTWTYQLQAPAPIALLGKPITWANTTGVTIAGNGLLKTNETAAWNTAGAISAETSSSDCSVSCVVNNNPNVSGLIARFAIGLDAVDSNQDYTDIQYALAANSNRQIGVYQNGTLIKVLGPVTVGDQLRVERIGNVINYVVNGEVRYSTLGTLGEELHADVALYYKDHSLDQITFYRSEDPAVYVVSQSPNITRYTQAPWPNAPTIVQNDSDPAGNIIIPNGCQNYRFRNFQTGYAPSDELRLSRVGNEILPLIFTVSGPIITNPQENIQINSPSGIGGLYQLTYPNGSTTRFYSKSNSITVAPQGSGIYQARLSTDNGYTTPVSTTNLLFQVTDLEVQPPSSAFSSAPLLVTASSTYPLNIYYTLGTGWPNIPYTNTLSFGASNINITFAGIRTNYNPQIVKRNYTFSSGLSLTPSGIFNNATVFTISAATESQYSVAGGTWQNYSGPFQLDGIPTGSSSIQIRAGEDTNSFPVTFKVATPNVTPPSSQQSGSYTVTATTTTTNANVYYAVGDHYGSIPNPNEITNLYTAPIVLEGSHTALFVARKTNYLDSTVVTNNYVTKIATPAFITPTTTFTNTATITVASGDAHGGRYILTAPDGSAQQQETTANTANFTINQRGNYTLVLRRTGSLDSDAVTNSYEFALTDVALNPPSSLFYTPLTLSYSWSPNPTLTTIYYTFNGSIPIQATPNLIINPGAEYPLVNGKIPYWTEVGTTTWGQRVINPSPQQGSYYFAPGAGTSPELRQDINISAVGESIDAGQLQVQFSGYVNTYGDGDKARIIIELRDAANTTVLAQYDSGDYTGTTWLKKSATITIPAGTRNIRVRLVSTRVAGTNCDGYYDNLSLNLEGVASFLYTGPFTITNDATIISRATRAGYQDQLFTNSYVFAPPTQVTPAPGTYSNAISVTITGPANTDYQINNTGWQPYTGPISLDGIGGGTVSLWTRYTLGQVQGPTNQWVYVFRTANPNVQPPSTNFSGNLTITAESATTGATLFYAMGNNLGDPTSSAAITNLYTGPITIDSSRQFIFEARKSGYQGSAQVTNSYTRQLPTPVFLTPAGTYTAPLSLEVQSLLLNTPQTFVLTYPSGAKTTNNAASHTTSFTINESGLFQLQVFRTNWNPSPIASNNYSFQVADIVIHPNSALNESTPLNVSYTWDLTNPKTPAIYYALNGDYPDTNTISVSSNLLINGGFESDITNGWTTITVSDRPWKRNTSNPTPIEGTYAAQVNADVDAFFEIYQDIPVSNWVNRPGGLSISGYGYGYPNRIAIAECRNASGTILSTQSTAWIGGYAWKEYKLWVTLPLNTTTLRLRLRIDGMQTYGSYDTEFDGWSVKFVESAGAYLYQAPFTLTNSTTVITKGTRAGYADQIFTNIYNFAPSLTIAPVAGEYSQPITVTLTPQNTGSVLYYSVNADDWRQYTTPFVIDGGTNGVAQLKAYAITGPDVSPTNKVTYTFKVAAPMVNPGSQNVNGTISVTATTTTPGASLYYAMSSAAGETPATSAITNLYETSVNITSTRALIFEGRKAGYLPSDPVYRVYSSPLPTPGFATASQTFTNQVSITVTSSVPGVTYHLQNPSGTISTVTVGSSSTSGIIYINQTGEYTLWGSKDNWLNSETSTQSYAFVVRDLKVTPQSGTFNTETLAVTAQSSISKPLKIYYTLDGSIPTTNDTLYTSAITLTNTTTITWLATRDYYASQLATNTYTSIPGISLSPPAGTYSNATAFTLATLAPSAQLYYSTNTTTWVPYTGAILLDGISAGTGTLRAYYTNANGCSPTNAFIINFKAIAPNVSPGNQTVTTPFPVTASCGTTNAEIYYVLSEIAPTTSNINARYTEPIVVSNRTFLTFVARKTGYQDSTAVQRKYITQLPTPVWLTSGTFSNAVTASMEIPAAFTNLSFRVVFPDGSTQTVSAPVKAATGHNTGSITANTTGDYVAYATGTDWLESEPATNHLTFQVRDLTTLDDQLFNTPVLQVTAGSSLTPPNTKPLVIYYTTDGSEVDTNAEVYTSGVPINQTTTFKWLATREGYTSQRKTNHYAYVAPMGISPAPGTYNNAITITLTPPAAEETVFSINGNAWQSYTGPINVNGAVGGILNLRTLYLGGTTNTFTYIFQTDPPTITPESQILTDPITLTASPGNTLGATTVYYEGNPGGSIPTTNDVAIPYTTPIQVNSSRSYLFQARKDYFLPSPTVLRSFTNQLPAPTVLTPSKEYYAPVTVQVQSGIPGYGGTYFMVTPSGITNKLVSEAPLANFQANETGTYTFFQQRAGWKNSDPVTWTASFRVTDLTVKPTSELISVPNTPITASGSSSNPKALKIYYTLDGTEPQTNSTIYSQPLLVNSNLTVRWLATREGYSPMRQTNNFIYVAGASISPSADSYNNAQAFTLTPLAGAQNPELFYKLGNAEEWENYTTPFVVDGTTDIYFYARVSGQNSATNKYSPKFKVAPLSVTPASQKGFSTPFDITVTTATTNASLLYGRGNTDGSWVYTSTIPFDGALRQDVNSANYFFTATKNGYTSATYRSDYEAKLPTLTTTLRTNLQISGPIQVTLNSEVPVNIYVSTNGSPSQKVTASLVTTYTTTISKPGTYSYTTTRGGWSTSDPLVLQVQLAKPDAFADRLELSLLSKGTNYSNGQAPQTYAAIGDISTATSEPGEWDGTFDDQGIITTDGGRVKSLWYRWKPGFNGLALFRILDNQTGQEIPLIYGVYTGDALGGLSLKLLTQQASELPVTEGTEYVIAVNDALTPSSVTEFQIQVQAYPTPSNDLLAKAIPMTMGQTYSGYTHGAGSEPNGEPQGNSTWWAYQAVQAGTLEIPINGMTPTLWTGNTTLTQIPAQYTTALDYNDPPRTTNNVFFRIETAGTYYVRLAEPKQTFVFVPKFHVTPAHDNFPQTKALTITSTKKTPNYVNTSFEKVDTSLGATLQTSEVGGYAGPTTVWYQFNAPDNGEMGASLYRTATYNSSYGVNTVRNEFPGIQLEAFTGNNFADMVPLLLMDNSTPVLQSLLPTNGQPAVNTTFEAAPIFTDPAVRLQGNVSSGGKTTQYWRWQASSTGRINIDVEPNGNRFTLTVYTGDREEDLVKQSVFMREDGPVSQSSKSYFQAENGEVYTIIFQVDTVSTNDYVLQLQPTAQVRASVNQGQLIFLRVSGIGAPHALEVNVAGRASNDSFADALEIPLKLYTYENGRKAMGTASGKLSGATLEAFETNGTRSVWYRILPTITGIGKVDQSGAWTTSIRVYSGTTTNDLTLLNAQKFQVTAGETYYIQVTDTVQSFYKLDVAVTELPKNDNFAQALTIEQPMFQAYNNLATWESGEPTQQNGLGNSVWWKINPSREGTMRASTAQNNKLISIWQGESLATLAAVAQSTNTLTQRLQANTQYYLSFDTKTGTDASDFTASLEYYPLPANDMFLNATDLVDRQNYTYANGKLFVYTVAGNNYGATTQLNEPLKHHSSVWFNWTAPENLMVHVACNLPVYIYTGELVSALTPISESAFSAVAGQTYRIAVAGEEAAFTLKLLCFQYPSNDNETESIPLTEKQDYGFYTYGASGEGLDQTTNAYSVWWNWTPQNTNGFIYIVSQRLGPDRTLQDKLPDYPAYVRLIDAQGGLVAEGTFNLKQYIGSHYFSASWTLPVPVQAGQTYRILVATEKPAICSIKTSVTELSEGYPPGSLYNPTTLSWNKKTFLNGTIYEQEITLRATDNNPYFYNLVFPNTGGFYSSLASHTMFYPDIPYTPYMLVEPAPALVVLDHELTYQKETLKVIDPPNNDLQAYPIVMPVTQSPANWTPSSLMPLTLQSSFDSYNYMAGTEDEYENSVWYIVYIPERGRLTMNHNTSSKVQLLYVQNSFTNTCVLSPGSQRFLTGETLNVKINPPPEIPSTWKWEAFYTTDGSTPGRSSIPYTGNIQVSQTTTLKAVVYFGSLEPAYGTATYTQYTPLEVVTEQTNQNIATIRLSSTDTNDTIYYRLTYVDGTTTQRITNNANPYGTLITVPQTNSTGWIAYSNAISLDGWGKGEIKLETTRAVEGEMNPIQSYDLQFVAPTPLPLSTNLFLPWDQAATNVIVNTPAGFTPQIKQADSNEEYHDMFPQGETYYYPITGPQITPQAEAAEKSFLIIATKPGYKNSMPVAVKVSTESLPKPEITITRLNPDTTKNTLVRFGTANLTNYPTASSIYTRYLRYQETTLPTYPEGNQNRLSLASIGGRNQFGVFTNLNIEQTFEYETSPPRLRVLAGKSDIWYDSWADYEKRKNGRPGSLAFTQIAGKVYETEKTVYTQPTSDGSVKIVSLTTYYELVTPEGALPLWKQFSSPFQGYQWDTTTTTDPNETVEMQWGDFGKVKITKSIHGRLTSAEVPTYDANNPTQGIFWKIPTPVVEDAKIQPQIRAGIVTDGINRFTHKLYRMTYWCSHYDIGSPIQASLLVRTDPLSIDIPAGPTWSTAGEGAGNIVGDALISPIDMYQTPTVVSYTNYTTLQPIIVTYWVKSGGRVTFYYAGWVNKYDKGNATPQGPYPWPGTENIRINPPYYAYPQGGSTIPTTQLPTTRVHMFEAGPAHIKPSDNF